MQQFLQKDKKEGKAEENSSAKGPAVQEEKVKELDKFFGKDPLRAGLMQTVELNRAQNRAGEAKSQAETNSQRMMRELQMRLTLPPAKTVGLEDLIESEEEAFDKLVSSRAPKGASAKAQKLFQKVMNKVKEIVPTKKVSTTKEV